MEKIIKSIKFIITTVAPAGVLNPKEINIPAKKQTKDTTTELIITLRKFLKSLIEVRDGKIIRAEISSVPITLIPITIVKAVSTAIIIL